MTVGVHALLLAAGRSSRTGASHKLLATFDGVPLVRHAAMTALASSAASVSVVLGYRAADLRDALSGLDVRFIDNPDWAKGLSTSVIAGFEAMPEDADGVLVMLADQPRLAPAHLDRLIDTFSTGGAGSLVVATDKGRQFNPVIIASSYRFEIACLSGDRGAKSLLMRYAEKVREVEIGDAASFDADTLDAIIAAGGVPEDGCRSG